MRSLEIQRREQAAWGDPMVVIVAIALAGLGLINVYASTGVHAGSAFLSRQATGLALGLVVTLLVTRLHKSPHLIGATRLRSYPASTHPV